MLLNPDTGEFQEHTPEKRPSSSSPVLLLQQSGHGSPLIHGVAPLVSVYRVELILYAHTFKQIYLKYLNNP